MIKDIDESKILQTESLNNSFKSTTLKDIGENCRILNTDFYLDSFNYFPITKKDECFAGLFKRQDDNPINPKKITPIRRHIKANPPPRISQIESISNYIPILQPTLTHKP